MGLPENNKIIITTNKDIKEERGRRFHMEKAVF